MKIVIEMEPQMWALVREGQIPVRAYECIVNGTPLPEGHGRLIDADVLAKKIMRAWNLWEKKGEDCYLFSDVLTPMLVSQKTIIEAEREDKDE